MTDAATISLELLGDPSQYQLLGSVPWFRAHRRKKNDGTETVVNNDDLREIAQHMQALEREGRLFRLTHGHINPVGDEDEQPELLGFARNARLDVFGPRRIPCVMVDEYARNDKLPILRERPYRSAEYYGKSKVITGAAALIRDPQLNLGAVLYNRDHEPWHYAEALMPTPETMNNDDYSPEEVQQYERMCAYLARKWPKAFAPDATARRDDEGTGENQPEQFQNGESLEMYALRTEAESAKRKAEQARKELEAIRQEREAEKCQIIVDDLARHYRLDPAREVRTLLPLNAAEREEHIAYIRANYSELPGGDPIELYRGHVEGEGFEVSPTASQYEATMSWLRAHPGMTYEQAVTAVRNN